MKHRKGKAAKGTLEKLLGSRLSLGSFLQAIRQGEEMTQVEFAKKLGISKQYLCDLERGRRFVSPKAAKQFAKNLGYSPEQFVRLCLQDIMDRDDVNLVISVKAT